MLLTVLAAAVLASALAVVHTKHQSRKLVIEMETLRLQRNELDLEWDLLQLEQSTLTMEAAVDHAARSRLGMQVPDSDTVVYVMQ